MIRNLSPLVGLFPTPVLANCDLSPVVLSYKGVKLGEWVEGGFVESATPFRVQSHQQAINQPPEATLDAFSALLGFPVSWVRGSGAGRGYVGSTTLQYKADTVPELGEVSFQFSPRVSGWFQTVGYGLVVHLVGDLYAVAYTSMPVRFDGGTVLLFDASKVDNKGISLGDSANLKGLMQYLGGAMVDRAMYSVKSGWRKQS